MIEIDRAGVKDHGVVTNLLLDFADTQGWQPEADRDRWDRVLAELLDSDSWLFLVARVEGEPVGLAAVNWFLTLYGSREEARLAALIVDADHRRRGVGSDLMDSALSAARRRGCRELEASVEPGDEATAAFYGKFGKRRERVLLSWPCTE